MGEGLDYLHIVGQALRLLVPVSCMHYCHFHLRPINQIVFLGPYSIKDDLILGEFHA